jgi:hypothetical protein
MKRPHMRSIVYASAAGAFICCGIFVQAAGPIGFVSRIWRERPVILRTKESRLNPMNWFGRKQADASDESVAADGRRTLERSELTIDPFLTESPAAASPASEAAKSPASNIVRAPLVVEQRTTLSATGLGAVDVPTTDRKRPNNPGTNASRQEESSLPAARRSPAQVTRVEATQRAPRLPTPGGFGAFESPAAGQTGRRAPTAAAPTTPQSRRRPAQANRIVKPSTGGNRFVGGFDAEFAKLVQSVIAETENGTVQAPVPRLPGTGGPSTRANDQTPSLAGGTSERRTTGSASETSSSGTPLLPSQSNISAIGSTPELSGVASEFSMASERAEFARYASQLTGESVSDVIEASRQRIANTPLAARQNMSREQLTAAQGRQGQPGSQVQPIESTRPRVPSDSRLNMRHETTMQITPGRAGSGFIIESPGSRPVRPRVTSNGAPLRSVPDHLEFERLSYQTDETMHAGPLADAAANGPLLMLPNEHHPNGQHFLEPAESDSNGNAAALPRTADSSTNWWPSEADTAAAEPGSGAGWVVAVMCLILTVIAGGYAARRKLQIDSFDITRIRQRFEKD